MNVRKWNRILHRDVGYFFFGMCIIYGISGIALNHRHQWNPNYIIRQSSFAAQENISAESITDESVKELLTRLSLEPSYKKFYFPEPQELRIFIDNGTITLTLTNGKGIVETIRRRLLFREVNILHYNNIKPKKLFRVFFPLLGD